MGVEKPFELGYIDWPLKGKHWAEIAAKLNMTPSELFERCNPGRMSYEDAVKNYNFSIFDFTRTDKFANLLKEKGYDGAFAKEYDRFTYTYAAVSPTQVKSAEPFTFDDNGELIPLSERFNPENDDIRFRETGEQLGLFTPEEMNGGVAGSQKGINFASNSKSDEGTESNIQRQGDRNARQDDMAGADDVRREGNIFGSTLSGRRAESLIPPLRKLEEGEMCLVERRMTEDKNFSFVGGGKIETLDDIAYIFKSLETKSIENSFLVFTGGRSNGAVVLHVGMGGIASTIVDLSPVLPMIEAERPSHVTLVHNHPSGNLTASREDMALLLLEQRVETFAPYVTVDPGIIIDTTKGTYGVFTAESNAVGAMPDKARGKETQIPVFKFDEQAFSADYNPLHLEQIRSSGDIAQFVATHRLGERKKVNILCLNNNSQVIGNFFSDLKEVATEDEAKRLARECAHYADICGSKNVCVYGSGISAKDSPLSNTILNLKKADIRLLDVLHIDENYGYDSYADRGIMEPEIQYGDISASDERNIETEDSIQYVTRIVNYMNGRYNAITPVHVLRRGWPTEELGRVTGFEGEQLEKLFETIDRKPENTAGFYDRGGTGHIFVFDSYEIDGRTIVPDVDDLAETYIHENLHAFFDSYRNFSDENSYSLFDYLSEIRKIAEDYFKEKLGDNYIAFKDNIQSHYGKGSDYAEEMSVRYLAIMLTKADTEAIEAANNKSDKNILSTFINEYGYAEKDDAGRRKGAMPEKGQGSGRLLGRGGSEQGGTAEEEVGSREDIDDSPVLFSTLEPSDYNYIGSAADLTDRCRTVGANLGVPVEVINEPLNATVSIYEGGTLRINIGALNGQSELLAALMAMSEKMSLSEILGDDAVRGFAQECYRELPEFRQKVVEIAQQRFGWNTSRAMMQYLGSLAESETADDEATKAWGVIRTAFENMLDRAFADKTPMGAYLIDMNQLRYILFKNAHQGDNSIAVMARGAKLAHAQGVSAADREIRADGAQAARVQQAQDNTGISAANLYNRVVSRMWSRMDETYRDQYEMCVIWLLAVSKILKIESKSQLISSLSFA